MIPTHAPCACICCRSAGEVHGMEYMQIHLLRQIETNRTERIKPQKNASWHQHHHSMVPETRACGGSATRSSLPPGNLAAPHKRLCLKARPRWHPLGSSLSSTRKKKSGHAAELNQPADRIARHGEKANFSLPSLWTLARARRHFLPATAPHTRGRDSLETREMHYETRQEP